MSAASTLLLTCTIQPELSFGLTAFVFQSMRPGKEATLYTAEARVARTARPGEAQKLLQGAHFEPP